MGLEDALGAIIEERQGQISASDDLPNEQDPDRDSDAGIAKSLETIASCVDWQGAAPDPAVESRSEAALLWASAVGRRCTLLIDAKELASRPLGPVRVRECHMALSLGPGCRAEHERPDRLYVNSVHWTNAQRDQGQVRAPRRQGCGDILHAVPPQRSRPVQAHGDTPRRWRPHEQARALEGSKHCLWRISTAMSDIVASGAEVMATGPCRLCEKMGVEPVNLCGLCGFEWHRSCCEKLSPGTLPNVSVRLRPHVLPDIFWDSKSIGAFCSLCDRWLEQSI